MVSIYIPQRASNRADFYMKQPKSLAVSTCGMYYVGKFIHGSLFLWISYIFILVLVFFNFIIIQQIIPRKISLVVLSSCIFV
jgi:hypothetical protein